MGHIIQKFEEAGNSGLTLRAGTSFGYNNLVVDPLNFGIMKRTGCPVVFDDSFSTNTRRPIQQVGEGRQFLNMLAGMSQGIVDCF